MGIEPSGSKFLDETLLNGTLLTLVPIFASIVLVYGTVGLFMEGYFWTGVVMLGFTLIVLRLTVLMFQIKPVK